MRSLIIYRKLLDFIIRFFNSVLDRSYNSRLQQQVFLVYVDSIFSQRKYRDIDNLRIMRLKTRNFLQIKF